MITNVKKQAVACTKTATLRGKLTDGITMAKRLLVAVALAVAFFGSAYAQQQTAVLQRGDSVLGVYYGINSFNQAVAASDHGDIITLSGGAFNSPTGNNPLSKAITIRGAGAVEDTARGIIPTVFLNDFRMDDISPDSANHLIIEGVAFNNGFFRKDNVHHVTINNPEFIRCTFLGSVVSDCGGYPLCGVVLQSGIFINCIIDFDLNDNDAPDGMFINCILFNCINSTSTLSNCIVRTDGEPDGVNAINTIFVRKSNSNDFTLNASSMTNCVVIGGNITNIHNSTTNTILPADSLSAVFETFTNSSNDIDLNTSYALTSRAAANFLGIDGTQVGIYGGGIPFGYVPTYNVIRRCTVAPRSTADGKLSVDIELETEQ